MYDNTHFKSQTSILTVDSVVNTPLKENRGVSKNTVLLLSWKVLSFI